MLPRLRSDPEKMFIAGRIDAGYDFSYLLYVII